MRQRTCIVAILVLLSLPLASAGTEASPEVRSPRDRPNANGDLLAAWVDGSPDGLLVAFKVAGIDRNAAAVVYVLRVEIAGRTYSPTVGFDQNGALRTDSGANLMRWPDVDDALEVMAVERGSPAYLSVVVPWELYAGLEPDAKVEVLGAYTSLCCQNGRWVTQYDEAKATGGGLGLGGSEFTVRPFATNLPAERGLLPILVPRWMIPTIVLACLAGGLAAGFRIARAASKRTPAAAPVSVPVRAPLPPPGERFRHAPPQRR